MINLDIFEIRHSNKYKVSAKMTHLGWVLMGCLKARNDESSCPVLAPCTAIHSNFL